MESILPDGGGRKYSDSQLIQQFSRGRARVCVPSDFSGRVPQILLPTTFLGAPFLASFGRSGAFG
jgi:hypothetical protein